MPFIKTLQLAETCQLAVERIQWLQSKEASHQSTNCAYSSVDPAPPCEGLATEELRKVLLDETRPLFSRYRAMFALRNRGDKTSILALTEG